MLSKLSLRRTQIAAQNVGFGGFPNPAVLEVEQQFQFRLSKSVTPNGATDELLNELAKGNKSEARIGHSDKVGIRREIS